MNKNFLAQCEQEPLARSGAIQPHGTLLAVDSQGRISHVAANIGDFLDRPPADWLGQYLPAELASHVASLGGAAGATRICPAAVDGPDGVLDVLLHRGEAGAIIAEFTRQPNEPPPLRHELQAMQLSNDISTDELMHLVAELTGFQRVMYYRFRDEGDGEVIAEYRQGDAYGSYLGLRFPASDIPRIARELYLKNPWRLIPDADAAPVPVLGQAQAAPDLTWSDLRSVSPVHQVYLANMEVRASLSFPVVVGGVLTALVAAHHRQPRRPPLVVLEQASSLVRGHTVQNTARQSERRMRLIDNLSRHFDVFQRILEQHGDLITAWPEMAAWLQCEFQVDGATLCMDNQWLQAGTGFEVAALEVLEQWFTAEQDEFLLTCDSLSRQVPGYPLSEVAGTLAIRVGPVKGHSLRLYLPRLEHIHEVAWGGNPEKPVEHHDGVLGIAPRRSFEKWIEKRLGYCRPWDNETRLLGLKLRELLQKCISLV